MWDKLPEIEKHSQQGSKLLQEFAQFCKNYNNSLKKFGADVNKHFETFNKNLQANDKDKKSFLDHNLFTKYNKAGASEGPNSARGDKDEEKTEKRATF